MLIAQGSNQVASEATVPSHSKQQDVDTDKGIKDKEHVTAALLTSEHLEQTDPCIDKWDSMNDLNSVLQQTSVIADAYDLDRETDLWRGSAYYNTNLVTRHIGAYSSLPV